MSLLDDALAAVVGSPDDDLPRLAYADLLLAAGDPRGEFIHAQCNLAHADLGYFERRELREKSETLQTLHLHTWLSVLGLTRKDRVTFRRGFIEHVELSASQIASPALDALFAREPVQSMQLTVDRERDVKDPTSLARIGHLQALTVRGRMAPGGVLTLIAKPLPKLRVLNLGSHLNPASFAALWSSENLPALQRLSVSGSSLSGALNARNATLCAHHALTTLWMNTCELEDSDIEGLVSGDRPVISQLMVLGIQNNSYGARGVRALVQSPGAMTLQSLELDLNDNGTVQALLEDNQLYSLKRLKLNEQIRLSTKYRDQFKLKYQKSLYFR
ncbi:MAG: TIGR02996 domain-containing protein [Deltaproteobacteria bacterium]|nr:TIGR02996 domain-containing protein [Deltaproteobacteria bacterium]